MSRGSGSGRPSSALLRTLFLAIGVSAVLVGKSGFAAEILRPEVAKPLQSARALYQAQRYKDALASVAQAEAVPGKSQYESDLVAQMGGAAAVAAGDLTVAARDYGLLIQSGRQPVAEQQKMMAALASLAYQQGNYAQAVQWSQRYQSAGAGDPHMKTLLAQSYYMAGNPGAAEKALRPAVDAEMHAGRAPDADALKLLASCYQKQGDNAGYAAMLEQLVKYYPAPAYWGELLDRLQADPKFAGRFELDVYRLKRATNTMGSASDYIQMAQLAVLAGHGAEALSVVNQGFNSGMLGNGTDAGRDERLRNLATKAADQPQPAATAGNGTALVETGFDEALSGKSQQGIASIETGLAKGGLADPDEARLHLGIAYYLAGQKDKALNAFDAVAGNGEAATLARLWKLVARST
jgi:tetratricopeptide (TPR) repeat protein